MGECKERHCGNGWRCFDFEIPYTPETADQKAHRNSRHFNAWMSNDQACPPVRRISGADIFHISLGEQPLTTRVHPRRGYFRENTITSGTGSARKIYPRIMGEGRPPVSAVSIVRLIQNGRQLNSTIKSLTVTFYYKLEGFQRVNIPYRSDSLFNIYQKSALHPLITVNRPRDHSIIRNYYHYSSFNIYLHLTFSSSRYLVVMLTESLEYSKEDFNNFLIIIKSSLFKCLIRQA